MQIDCKNHNSREKNIACLKREKKNEKGGCALLTSRQVIELLYCTEGDLPFFIFYLKIFW